MEMTMSTGLRRKRLSSRSMMAHVRPICWSLVLGAWSLVLRSSYCEGAFGRVRFLQRIAQRAAGVMDEHVVERRALDREGLHGDAGLRRHFHQRQRGRRSVVRFDAKHRVLAADTFDVGQLLQ